MSTRMKTDRLRIGLVFDDSLDAPDGVQQYVLTVGRWLTREGHDVHYLVGQTSRQDIPNLHSLARNWRVKFNGNRLSIPLPASKRQLRQLLQDADFDIIHVQVPYSPLLAGRIIRLLPAKTGVVGSFHVLPYSFSVMLANRILALLNRHTAKRFDVMLANTVPTAEFAGRVYGFAPAVVPNPFPLKHFTSHPATADDAKLTIVFLGRLVERKGAFELVRAIQYLRRQGLSKRSFRVLIGGKGSQAEPIKRYLAQHKLDDIVELKGFVDESDKPAFLAQADIAVFPSTSGESFGISLLEGMAAARGVVLAGDNPGYRAVLEPLSERQLVRPLDTPAFAQILADYLEDDEARRLASHAQREYVRRFDITVVGPQIEDAYFKALRSRPNMR